MRTDSSSTGQLAMKLLQLYVVLRWPYVADMSLQFQLLCQNSNY